MNRFRPCHCALGAALAVFLPAATTVQAGTLLEYDVTGDCATEFTRMRFDGLYARIDQSMDGTAMSTIFDDSEQLAHLLMHDTRNVMTMESDDDAVDFQSDVGKSTLHFAENRVQALTGMDSNDLMAQARAAQAAACPELAEMGFADPDYPAAAERCAQTMQAQAQAALGSRADRVEAMARRRDGSGGTQAPSNAPQPEGGMRWRTVAVDRDGGEETIDGRSCQVETTRRGDTVLLEECVVEIDKLGLEASPMRRLKRIVAIGEGMSEGISQMHPELNDDSDGPTTMPLRRTCYANGRQTGTATLRIVRDVAIPADVFDVPAGYTPYDMSMPDESVPDEFDSIDLESMMQRRR